MEDLKDDDENVIKFLYIRNAKMKASLCEMEHGNLQPDSSNNATLSAGSGFNIPMPLGDTSTKNENPKQKTATTAETSLHDDRESIRNEDDIGVLYRCKTVGTKPCAEVSKELTFRKHWSHNYPVYNAYVRIKNTCNDKIAYKVVPSHPGKLWLNEPCGILPEQSSTQVFISTNPMVPYKYVDISYETVKVLVTRVKFKKKKPEENLIVKELSKFWRQWENHPSVVCAPCETHTISIILPYDDAYLLETSEFWFMNARAHLAIWIRNFRPIDGIKYFCSGIRHFLSTDTDTEMETMISFDGEGIATFDEIRMVEQKLQVLKFLILGISLYLAISLFYKIYG